MIPYKPGNGNGNGNGNGHANGLGNNLAYTKFLFAITRLEDESATARLRAAGASIARGFFNDFDLDDSRDTQPQSLETIQFFVRDGDLLPPAPGCVGPCINKARHLAHLSSKYRPRLQEIEEEFRRRIGDNVEVLSIDGALRNPRYSSAELHHYASHLAPVRRSGRTTRNAIVIPIRKTPEWWEQSTLDRHAYFYPHFDKASGCPVKGHAQAAEPGVAALHRRLYHNPDGYQRPNEYDFVTYFECDDESLPVFDRVLGALRDTRQNPEWRFVEEGPTWRGKRVLRW